MPIQYNINCKSIHFNKSNNEIQIIFNGDVPFTEYDLSLIVHKSDEHNLNNISIEYHYTDDKSLSSLFAIMQTLKAAIDNCIITLYTDKDISNIIEDNQIIKLCIANYIIYN